MITMPICSTNVLLGQNHITKDEKNKKCKMSQKTNNQPKMQCINRNTIAITIQ